MAKRLKCPKFLQGRKEEWSASLTESCGKDSKGCEQKCMNSREHI
jgi:hypothetical protein